MPYAVGDSVANSFHVGDLMVTKLYRGDDLLFDLPPVTMTVEGTVFQPILELSEGSDSTVEWVDETDSVLATGLAPTITFPDATSREVKLVVSQPSDVVTLNLGFHEGQDAGKESLPSSYRHPTQPVTSIANLQNLNELRRFMAARTGGGVDPSYTAYNGPLLSGYLDFTGMNTIEYIETYRSEVSSVALQGCTSLIRLCLEGVALSSPLDLNPVRHNLRDLRAAVQQTGSLTIAPLDGPLESLWHFCTRDQPLYGFPGVENLPVVEQLWVWSNYLVMEELHLQSTVLDSVLLSSTGVSTNQVTYLNFENAVWQDLSGLLRADSCYVEAVSLTGMTPIGRISLMDNSLNPTMLDHILETVESWGTSGGTLSLEGNAAPSSSGVAAANLLISRGWTVTYDSPVSPTITTETVMQLEVNIAFSQTFAATGDPIITWAVTAGTLPDGLTLATDGTLSGTPTTEGAYDFTVTATNDTGSDTQQYIGAVVGPGEGVYILWEDEFDRPDAVGWANSGGWYPAPGETDTDVRILGGGLRLSGPGRYRRWLHAADTSLPADFEVEIGWTNPTAAGRGGYWGVCARVGTDGSGVKAFVAASAGTGFRIGDAATYGDGVQADISGIAPATWSDPGDHTLRMRCEGDQITAYIDGVQVHQVTFAHNSTLAGGAVGFCGEGQNRTWNYIRVYSL